MQILRWLLISLVMVAIQTVILERMLFWGATADLILVAVIVITGLGKKEARWFSIGAGFLQDILGRGIYINTLTKILVYTTTRMARENFVGDENFLITVLVLVISPLLVLLVGGIQIYLGQDIAIRSFILLLVTTTIYNLILTIVTAPVLKKL